MQRFSPPKNGNKQELRYIGSSIDREYPWTENVDEMVADNTHAGFYLHATIIPSKK